MVDRRSIARSDVIAELGSRLNLMDLTPFEFENLEGANKGILASTSRYGSDAFNFANDKPIELIEEGGLLYLLENHAGVNARIVMPEE